MSVFPPFNKNVQLGCAVAGDNCGHCGPVEAAPNPPCRSCGGPLFKETELQLEVCGDCYRDPETNNCETCGRHLSGIPYPYDCGACVTKE